MLKGAARVPHILYFSALCREQYKPWSAASPPWGQGLGLAPPQLFFYLISGWNYSSGFITTDMIKEHLPAPGKSTFILVCGPPPLVQTAAHPNLEKLGYTKDMIFTY